MEKLSNTILVLSMVILFSCDATGIIVSWSNPEISGASGSGNVQGRINEGSSGSLNIQIQANTDKLPYPFPLYTILKNPEGLIFAIDRDHGHLSLLQGTLDYEKSPNVVVIVKVDDAEGVGTATCTIRLVDINDNAPYFPTKTTSMIVGNLLGGDGNTNGDFSIGRSNGAITVAQGKSLNQDRVKYYSLLVMATDGGTVPKAHSSTITVNVCVGECEETSHSNAILPNIVTVIIAFAVILIFF